MFFYQNEARQISLQISKILDTAGIYYRIFSRGKSDDSLHKKINKVPGKYDQNKKIQDLIGVRVCLYFSDDIDITKSLLCEKFNYDSKSSTIDLPHDTEFGPTRYNLIYKLPQDIEETIRPSPTFSNLIDKTFEVQIRTILSEGWHEVEHDLRYKFPSDWQTTSRENRALNSVLATLETAEWSTLKLIDDLAHLHYKNKNWEAMIRSKFRLRFTDQPLDNNLIRWLNSDEKSAKAIFRTDREELIYLFAKLKSIPITMSNLIYALNYQKTLDEEIKESTPRFLNNILTSL